MAAGILLAASPGVVAQRHPPKNLQVLPKDISEDDLSEVMLGNLRGLGLRRLAGQGCLFCHVGNLEQPRSTWDYASDEKPMKRKARVMMAMVREINDEFLPRLEPRIAADSRVTCYTCHSGRTDPRPLPDVLRASYAAGGVDSVRTRYRSLRRRYYGSDAYDFRRGVLEGLALEQADSGRLGDAIALATIETEAYPDDAEAERALIRLGLERTIDEQGLSRGLAWFDSVAAQNPTVIRPALLDGLAWRLYRRDREAEARAIAAANLARFPNSYIPNESTAFMLRSAGDLDGAIRLLERWLTDHPNHARARRLLVNMRRE